MQYHNMTKTELESKAIVENNELAVELIKYYNCNCENCTLLEQQNDDLKQAYLELLSDQFKTIYDDIIASYNKDGYMYESYCDTLGGSVEQECLNSNKASDNFINHVSDVIKGIDHVLDHNDKLKWVKVYNIDEKLGVSLESFTDNQWYLLAEKAAQDIYSSFTNNRYNNYYVGNNCFYSCGFGEIETEKEWLNLFNDMSEHITDDDINSVADFYVSGSYIYIDMSDCGIQWAINLNWLETAIVEVLDETEQ